VDGELGLAGCEAKGQPGEFPYRERLVEHRGQSVKVGCEGGRGGGTVGDEEADRSAVVDLGCNSEGEDTFCISEDTSSDVGKGAAISEACGC